MCNLNILIRNSKKRMTKKAVEGIVGFMQSSTSHSYVTNKDADGVMFSSGCLVRQTNKINFVSYMDEIKTSKHIMSHQRFSTSGSADDIHPFLFGDLIMAHNGVMQSYASDKFSDSYHFFELINKHFEEALATGLTRDEALVKAIKIELDGKMAGSYSISIFDKVTESMYYFKNYGRVINIYSSPSYLYMTTNAANNLFLGMLGEEFVSVDLQIMDIYKVVESDDNQLSFQKIGDIKPYTYVPKPVVQSTINHDRFYQQNRTSYGANHYVPPTNNAFKREYEELEDEEDDYYGFNSRQLRKARPQTDDSDLSDINYDGYFKVKKFKACKHCGTFTKFREEGSGTPVCEYCIDYI